MAGFASWLDRHCYPQLSSSWDNTKFRQIILRHLRPKDVVLDLGAGRGALPQMNFRGLGCRVHGVDPSEAVRQNPFLDEAKVAFAEAIPYPDNMFDLVIANNVLEHLAEPEKAFKEVLRVLRPDGLFLAKTPNRFHYVAVCALLTPQWFHELFNRLRGRATEDTFPTKYRANTQQKLRKLAATSGLEIVNIARVEGRPEYLRITPVTYLLGIAYERLVNCSEWFAPFRVVIFAALRKPKAAGQEHGLAMTGSKSGMDPGPCAPTKIA